MTAPLSTAQPDLFGVADALPPGFAFTPEFVSPAEEAALLAMAAALPLAAARYHQYTARRRVHAWGSLRSEVVEGGDEFRQPIVALPPPLVALRERIAAWTGVAAADFVQVMVSEYRPGTPLGWHRDAPQYELIAGVSLGGPARLRFRPWPPESATPAEVLNLDLAPRSAYVMRGAARWGWQHGLPPVMALRYSVTMRTARG